MEKSYEDGISGYNTNLRNKYYFIGWADIENIMKEIADEKKCFLRIINGDGLKIFIFAKVLNK